MSRPPPPGPPPPAADAHPPPAGRDDDEGDRVLDLLRPTGAAPDLLPRVQERIRRRSRGRFYGDAWSLGTGSPVAYLVTAALVLAVLGILYVVLSPGGTVIP